MFEAILGVEDAARATAVIDDLLALGFRGALTGSLAIGAHLHARGKASGRRPLNDVDFVVQDFAAIPESLADRFLLNHVHPLASEGKTLMQVIDPAHALRVDLFRACGATLSRRAPLGQETGPLEVVSFEDLMARTTAHVYGHLRAGRAIDAKHAQTFIELLGLAGGPALEPAWQDHRNDLACSQKEAAEDAHRLLALYPDLVTSETYSREIVPCERCQPHGRFHCAPPERIVEVLGYW